MANDLKVIGTLLVLNGHTATPKEGFSVKTVDDTVVVTTKAGDKWTLKATDTVDGVDFDTVEELFEAVAGLSADAAPEEPEV